MTNQIPPGAPASGPHPVPSGQDAKGREDALAVSPAVGPLPPVYVPSASGEETNVSLLWQATARAARVVGGWPPGTGRITGHHGKDHKRSWEDRMTAVPWEHVTHGDVVRAIQEYDRLAPGEFFSEHGFGPTTTYDLIWEERRYPPKAILGTAYELATGQRLASGDFEGGKSGAVRVLGKLGFTIQARRPAR